ncbi:hypothetical protein F4809DRAFT_107653 [Biscogniauxia mediterranea]|nr:hypothetical protein F4809DRAFT_107653 [Biscogniauxia mediterranea]
MQLTGTMPVCTVEVGPITSCAQLTFLEPSPPAKPARLDNILFRYFFFIFFSSSLMVVYIMSSPDLACCTWLGVGTRYLIVFSYFFFPFWHVCSWRVYELGDQLLTHRYLSSSTTYAVCFSVPVDTCCPSSRSFIHPATHTAKEQHCGQGCLFVRPVAGRSREN